MTKGRKIDEIGLNKVLNNGTLVQVSFKTSPQIKRFIVDESKLREVTISEVMNDIMSLYVDNENMIKTYKDSIKDFIRSHWSKLEDQEKVTERFMQIFDKNKKGRGL